MSDHTPTTDPRLAAVLAAIFGDPTPWCAVMPDDPNDYEPDRLTDRQAERIYAADADHAAERACAY